MRIKYGWCFKVLVDHLLTGALGIGLFFWGGAYSSQLSASTAIAVKDDARQWVKLTSPAKRIISLAPHTTELLFAAGAGDKVVGVISFSNYPAQAKQITQVGRFDAIAVETIISLQPDLIVAWRSGNANAGIQTLQRQGYPIYFSEPTRLIAIPEQLEALGKLAGVEETANRAAETFRQRLKSLQTQYSTKNNQQKKQPTVFFLVSQTPLMTVNKNHIINDVISSCGGVNPFADLAPLVPIISIEQLLVTSPSVIVAPSSAQQNGWSAQLKQLPAIQQNRVIYLEADHILRPTPRILLAMQSLCEQLASIGSPVDK
ncbi:cobalamin-binding protein [Endozoicomonas sp. SM1973]|uniref:Cobalamin-binding protein n=1 Tax=Spartinivicinus marinus TaxID=2994442 RepID=A0A853I5C9_9GAMM|nr:cobalamin-binding protein [Spartinivicinus marinus]MCX4029194.1 cobalamin-binding protein [Spartinivicinus marinus]NYZ65898.1 cobalamin-binding protein [Spartinivicinus marinus]